LVSVDLINVTAEGYMRMDAKEKLAIIESFALHNSLQFFPNLLYGSERLELKGSEYFADRLVSAELV
jgi:hypothetical protein